MNPARKKTYIRMEQCFTGDPRKGCTQTAKVGDLVYHTELAELPRKLHGPYRIRAITCTDPRDDPYGLFTWPMVWLDRTDADIPVPSTRIVKINNK